MTEQPPSSEPETQIQAPAADAAGWTPPDSPGANDSGAGQAGLIDEHPEIGVGAAFAGGFVLAMILKRLGR